MDEMGTEELNRCTECGAAEQHEADCTVLAEKNADRAAEAAEFGGEW